jgi:hypothetical protein
LRVKIAEGALALAILQEIGDSRTHFAAFGCCRSWAVVAAEWLVAGGVDGDRARGQPRSIPSCDEGARSGRRTIRKALTNPRRQARTGMSIATWSARALA